MPDAVRSNVFDRRTHLNGICVMVDGFVQMLRRHPGASNGLYDKANFQERRSGCR